MEGLVSLDCVLWSDFVCPFCFILERGSLARLQREYEVQLDWRGFEVHPETPSVGMPLTALFPPPLLEGMLARIEQLAARQGVELRVPERVHSSRAALAVAEWARSQGRLDAYRHRVMDACWLEGQDIGKHDVLAALAEELGLDGDEALRAASDPEWLQAVDFLREEASEHGLTGVPALFLGRHPVFGAQSYGPLAAAAARAGARLRPGPGA